MDCNKTINFLHELKRLCDSRDECVANAANKEDCPMVGICSCGLTNLCAEDAKKTVQKWSDEHPKKTYAQDFLEKFPEAQRNWDGVPFVCRKRIYESTVEYTRQHLRVAMTRKPAIDAGTSQWRNDNG